MVIIGGLGSLIGSFLRRGAHLHPADRARQLLPAIFGPFGIRSARDDRAPALHDRRRAHHLLPDRRAARPRAALADRQSKNSASGRSPTEAAARSRTRSRRCREGPDERKAMSLRHTMRPGPPRRPLAGGLILPRRQRAGLDLSSRSSPTAPAPSRAPAFRSPTACTTISSMLNERDGGIGGVKLVLEECETGYDTKKGVECYEAVKSQEPGHGQSVVDRHHAAADPARLRRQDPDPVHGLWPLGLGARRHVPLGVQPAGHLLGRPVDDHQVHRRARRAGSTSSRARRSATSISTPASARSRSRCSRSSRRSSASS